MPSRHSLLAASFIAWLSQLARASSIDTCSSGLAETLVPFVSICAPARSFCSSHYPQPHVTATITESNTITETASTSTNTLSTTTTVTVTAADVTATASTVTLTSSTVSVSLVALTTTTTTTTTYTSTATSYTATATCPPFNGAGSKRSLTASSPPPNCRPLSSTTTTTTTTQDPCSSAVSVLSNIIPSDASTICGCVGTPITDTQTATPTVTVTASAETRVTTTIITTVTPTETITPTTTLYPTITTPAPSTYTSIVSTTVTTTTSMMQYDGGQVTGSSSCGCVYLVDCGLTTTGASPYDTYSSPSIQECANDCSNSNGNCKGAGFRISTGQCTLYGRTIQSYSDDIDNVLIVRYYCCLVS